MNTFINYVVALLTLLWGSAGMAAETRVIINLSDQSVSLIEGGRIILVSPIASGKPGCRRRRAISAFTTRTSTICPGALD